VIVINQGIMDHIKFNPEYVQTCSFIGNLIDQAITHHTKFNPE